MTIAARVRAHALWASYVEARARGDKEAASTYSHDIACDLGITETQRMHNLPKIAAQVKPVGWTKGRRRKPPFETECPHCGHELVIEVTR